MKKAEGTRVDKITIWLKNYNHNPRVQDPRQLCPQRGHENLTPPTPHTHFQDRYQ
ncbi:hypothetical protein [Fischerella muscicola]|uniref:hypothetical protein n=1 Tax=Fischerella muscicola TaxID=92938 RepID=UPI0002F5D2F1|nr:hypothetical protein [Fischerella muscicola]